MSDKPVVANAAPDEANQSMAQHEPNAIPASLTQDDKKGSTATTQEVAKTADYIQSAFTTFENGIVETVTQRLTTFENKMVEKVTQRVTTYGYNKEMLVRFCQDELTGFEKEMVEMVTQTVTTFEQGIIEKLQQSMDRRNNTLLQMRQGLKKLDNAMSSTHAKIGDQQTEMQELASDGKKTTKEFTAAMDKQCTEALELLTSVKESVRRLGREEDVRQRVIGLMQNRFNEARERMDALEV
ncbi:hypothetical protein FPOAC2_03732 [Fusarium poae]|jgi:methyl-accepting chemotaxis protein|uniref:hypothetical protein n=1 Tax=Fusarium poae TaxID=36050 RepID=UPI001CE8CB35|nr:hypothetical protein FPOAC1_003621 [Fusarium poae]KAG8677597.1 hypothetical protein FPOAC1_003621 [Fusarium poae]